MGLEGTLRAFSVPDVFQVLGLQKKTGILVIDGPNDTITVFVLAGQIVAADSRARSLEDRFSNHLVLSGKLGSEGLEAALASQRNTREPLAVLLAREDLVSPEDLGEAMRLQVLRIVRSAFGWSEGKFRFRQQVVSDHNGALPVPIPTEPLLRDAARELDEWPKLRTKIPSPDGVYRRVKGLENLRLSSPPEQSGEGVLAVPRHESEAWRWVNGERRVGEIVERAFLTEFDTYRGLAGLIERDLITQAGMAFGVEAPPPPRRARVSVRAIGLWAVFLLLLTSAFRQVPRHPWNLFLRPAGEFREVSGLFKAVSFVRLAALERAVRVFYDSSGKYPGSLEELLSSGVLTAEGATDPWGRQYRYILRPGAGKFTLYGRNAQGDIDLDLFFERSLAPVSEPGPAAETPRRDRKPGVRIIK